MRKARASLLSSPPVEHTEASSLTLWAVVVARRDHEGMRNADLHLMMTTPALLRHGRVFTRARHPSRQTKHRGRRGYRKESRGSSGPPLPSMSSSAHPSLLPASHSRARPGGDRVPAAGLSSYSQRFWVRCMQAHRVGEGKECEERQSPTHARRGHRNTALL